MLPMIPMVIIGLGSAAVILGKGQKPKTLTPERAIVFATAMNTVKDPDKLRELSAVFAGEGLTTQAEMLEKRARLKELPKEVLQARRDAFHQAMASTNKEGILRVADAYEAEGIVGAAATLRAYAAGL